MNLSKSFGYALRGILYISLMDDENRKVQVDEIAENLAVPRHFLGKIMKQVAKAGIIGSTRGKQGGFFITKNTLITPLIEIVYLTDGKDHFNSCLLSLRKCNASNPCPLHNKFTKHRKGIFNVYSQTTIGDLLRENKPEFIKSIATQ
jgi:Rrf2 family transcriptional regulator, iron-sulfur cluster assembly transcription factor